MKYDNFCNSCSNQWQSRDEVIECPDCGSIEMTNIWDEFDETSIKEYVIQKDNEELYDDE